MRPMARFCFVCFAAPRVRLDVIVAAAVDAVVAVRNYTSRHDISVAQVRRVF
jgi:hypothetical protein